jgi:hypothetical protein
MRDILFVLLCALAAPACLLPQQDEPGEPTGTVVDHPTYHEHVGPILNARCVSCHSDGNIAPFTLIGYESAVAYSAAARAATEARTMPPWHVEDGGDCNSYRDSRKLSDAEIGTIARWVEQGTPEGDPANAPPPPPSGPTALDHVSVSLEPAEPYTPDASLEDDYRCFLVDPGLDADAFLTGYHVKPGARELVHHVVLFTLDTATDEALVESLDAADAQPGYQCFGGSGATGSRGVVVWAPGTGATRYPQGTGLRLLAGRKMAMQVHYSLLAGAAPDLTKVDLALADSVDQEATLSASYDVDLNLAPGQASATETASAPLAPLPFAVQVHGVYPHMHKLGRSLRVEVDELTGTSCLVNVPAWDFNWQQFYFYDEPVVIEPGPTLFRIACGYDTRGQTETVHWGEGTGDEMCIAAFYVTY